MVPPGRIVRFILEQIDLIFACCEQHRSAKSIGIERHRGHLVDRRLNACAIVASDR